MSAELAVFLILAAFAIAGAVNLIVQRHPIHSALSLIVVMVSLAGLYLLLGAELVAAIQVIVYAGAIMVLFVFVIMLLNAGSEEHSNFSQLARYAALPLGSLLLVVIGYQLARASGLLTVQPLAENSMRAVALMLFRNFAFPFEFTSIVILIALMGALVLAKGDRE